MTNARLVVRGYEEEEKSRSDSPTCSKDNIRIFLCLAVAKGWTVCSLDVKAAFLQGKEIERDLFLLPPKEFRSKGKVWKLKKVVYGLFDASRNWYLRLWQVLSDLGVQPLKYDKAAFLWKNYDRVEGAILMHVDDLLYFGTDDFMTRVIEPLKSCFKISKLESETFKYVGINITQKKEYVLLDQKDYLNSMKNTLLESDLLKDKDRLTTPEERKVLRSGVGQLGWISGITKPEASFSFCYLSTLQSNPQIGDFIKLQKAV